MGKSAFLSLIEGNTKNNIVSIKGKTIDNSDMNFYNSEIKLYYFYDCTFTKDFDFYPNEKEIETEFKFDKCVFTGNIDFNAPHCDFKSSIVFISTTHDNSHNSLLRFHATFSERIFIKNIKFKELLNIEFSSLPDKERLYHSIIIRDCNQTIDEISFDGIKVEELIIRDSHINNISLEKMIISNKLDIVNIKNISELKLDNVDFEENSKNRIENLTVNDFILKKVSQDAKYIQFHHILVQNKFICKRIELKNTYFNDFDISKADKSIQKTSFIDAHLNSIEWGKIDKIKTTQDIFRQLKFVNDKQGNHIEANTFYMMEMKKYKDTIKEKNFQDKIVFYFNETISDFGQSWIKPFVIYLVFGLLFSILMYACLPIKDDITGKNIEFFKILVDSFNPISKDIIKNYSLGGLIYKVISGLILYQFIMALKRQTKR